MIGSVILLANFGSGRKKGRFEKKTERPERKGGFAGVAFWCIALLYWEVLLHIVVFGGFTGKFLYAVGFSIGAGLLLGLLTSFVPKKANFWVSLAVALVLTFLYGSQIVYNFIFGTLYSVSQMGQGGAAITSFWRETLTTMWEKLPWLLLLLVPEIAQILLRRFLPGLFHGEYSVLHRVIMAAAVVAVNLLVILSLQLGGTGMFSDHYFYYSDTAATNQTAERFGLLTTFRLELFGSGGGGKEEEPSYYVPVEVTEAPQQTEPVPGEVPGETVPEEKPVEYNVMEFDFDALNAMTEDERIKAINNYCAQLSGTKKNEYTGMLKDYNLILLCAESFSTAAIHPEVTPTLYRLANEGIIFNNYYNTYPNTTTNGEYTMLQGLYPDMSRTQDVSSMYACRKSYLPFVFGNAFKDQLGVPCYGYHNYNGQYYGREESHPNMGYTMKFAGDGMTFTTNWPASDLEMMEQSIDDYIGQDQFHAYYMTFSGHYKYDVEINSMAHRNWQEVKDLNYNYVCRSYLSCNIELDKALAYLLQRLEEEGIADKTAIVLAGDHFPYGLSDQSYSELIGYKIDEFSKYKSTLIFWVGGLEENIVVDEYCCNADILPTVLNLWGIEYDSRMLAGTDVFSDGPHVAVLVNKSFLTDKVWFSTNTGKVKYLVDESEVPEGYVENMIRLVETRFAISSDILNTAYYNFVFGKEMVEVNRNSWD